MKKFLFLAFTFLISGCASPQLASQKMHSQQSKENYAWNLIADRSEVECDYQPGIRTKRDEALKQRECINKLIDEELMPISAFPENLKNFQFAMADAAKMYQKGVIGYPEYKSRLKSASGSYDDAWAYQANQKIVNADINRRRLSTLAGAAASGTETYNQSRQEAWEQKQANKPVTVHCTEGLGTYHCQQY